VDVFKQNINRRRASRAHQSVSSSLSQSYLQTVVGYVRRLLNQFPLSELVKQKFHTRFNSKNEKYMRNAARRFAEVYGGLHPL
jgi:hypothetical protein